MQNIRVSEKGTLEMQDNHAAGMLADTCLETFGELLDEMDKASAAGANIRAVLPEDTCEKLDIVLEFAERLHNSFCQDEKSGACGQVERVIQMGHMLKRMLCGFQLFDGKDDGNEDHESESAHSQGDASS